MPASPIAMSTNFPSEVVSGIFSKVRGHSALARLSGQTPIAFTGNDVFVFSLDDEVNLVAEGGQKTEGSAAAVPVRIVPLKVEYGARVTDEFMYAAEEKQLDILGAFMDGYARKIARGLDIMAFHGVNPRSKAKSTAIGTNCFDFNSGVTAIMYSSGSELANLKAAVAAVGDADITGYALSRSFAEALSTVAVGHTAPFSAFMLGANPGTLNGTPADVNSTVSFTGVAADGSDSTVYVTDHAIVGDFANAFKWGYSKQIPIEVIPYGDPDGNGDLKRTNQVFIRAEAWIGWGILDAGAFARVSANPQ